MGVREAANYKKQMVFWQAMEQLASFFITELRFTCDEPMKIFSRYLRQCDYEIDLSNVTLKQGFGEFLSQGLQCEWARDEESVVSFVNGLGATDLEGQLSHCGRHQRIFAFKYENSCEAYRVQGKLRQKLWMLAGAATTVLFL